MFPWNLYFSWRDLWHFPFYCFLLFHCIVHLRLSYLSLLFSGALHSVGFMFPFLLCLLLLFFSQLLFKDSSDNHFVFLHIFFFGMVVVSTSCTMLWISVHSSSGILSTRSSPWIYSSPDCTIIGMWFRSCLNGLLISLLSSIWDWIFAIRSSEYEPQSAPVLIFADCIELLYLWLQRI